VHAATLAVLAAVLTVAAAPAASAQAASTVSVEGDVLLVVAAPGESNRVSVHPYPSDESPQDYEVGDDSVGATAGPGCRAGTDRSGSPVVCLAAGVQRIVVRLGDGDDRVYWFGYSSPIPLELYGEAGRDDVSSAAVSAPGTLVDGGEGDDQLRGTADIARGGPGNDGIVGARLLEGGEGDDTLSKSSSDGAPGRLDAGPGDDRLQSRDGHLDELLCGDGRDVVVRADDSERPDASCESGQGVARVVTPRVTVFELPKGRTRPGRDGRLAVWMKCSVPDCAVTVQIRAAGDAGTENFVRFRPRQAPIRRLVVGTKAKLVRLRLSRAQRRGLRRVKGPTTVAAVVTATGPGGRTKTLTDGWFCPRSDPCDGGR
jgi:hypothetical protein